MTIPFDVSEVMTKLGIDKSKAVITEEGWPSLSGSGQNSDASIAAEMDYYKSWVTRSASTGQNTPTFYFEMFDNQLASANPVDANNYFGLCTADRQVKDVGLTSKCHA